MKTHVHAAAVQETRLRRALLVYENHETAFVTVHDAGVTGKGPPRIGPGVPATRAALATLAQKLAASTSIAGFVPPELVYMSPKVIAWWRPAAPARIFFKPPDDRALAKREKVRISTRNGTTPQPDLIFAVTGNAWFVWAVDAVDAALRPGADTPLHRAPYFNVWKTGQICTGNVKLPDAMHPDVLKSYETAFFGSNFTWPNDAQGLTRYAGGPFGLWRDLLDGKHAAFPVKSLPPLKRTLAETIKELETRHGR